MSLFFDGKKLIDKSHIMDLFELDRNSSIDQIDDKFDLNSQWHGVKFARDQVPKNGKHSWCLYFDFEPDSYNRFQIAISIDCTVEVRTYGGSGKWWSWTQIGGGK